MNEIGHDYNVAKVLRSSISAQAAQHLRIQYITDSISHRISHGLAFFSQTTGHIRLGATDHTHFAVVFNRIRPVRKVGGYYSELEVIVKVSYTVGEGSSLAMAGEDFRPDFE